MNSQKLIPIAAAALGFALAWFLKPGGTTANPGSGAEANPNTSSRNENSKPRPRESFTKRPKEVKPGDFPLVELSEQGPKTKSEAKLLRLSEALGLSIDQQGRILSTIEAAKTPADPDAQPLQDMAARGKAILEALAKILTPEQLAKFEEIRVRERDNLIESRSQRTLGQFLENVDLSPDQRNEVGARLRQYIKEQIQSVPSSATLLLDTSLLPTEDLSISLEGVLTLASLGDDPADPNDPVGTHQRVLMRQREELERLLVCFDGVLTPAQMGQIHAILAEKKSTLEKLRQLQAEKGSPTPEPPPAPKPRTVIGPSPEDDVEEP
jgi:hypothetical protein